MSEPEATKRARIHDSFNSITDPWAGFLHESNLHHILLSLYPHEAFFGPKSCVFPEVEPPPHRIDYRTIHMMLTICRSGLSKHYLKRWDYLADSRKEYFILHYKFSWAFHGLQDAKAFEEIMVKKAGDIKEQIGDWTREGVTGAGMEKKRKELEDLMFQVERNRAEMPRLTEIVKALAKKRDRAAAWLGNLKTILMKDDLRMLVCLTKNLLQKVKSQLATEDEPSLSLTRIEKIHKLCEATSNAMRE